jgi:hypothetical protein
MSNNYLKGSVVRLSVAFTNAAGDAADPAGVEFDLQPPTGDKVTYIYGVDAELEKDSVGNYHVDYTVTEEGIFWYKFTGTGVNSAVAEAWFFGDEDRTE